MGSQKNNNQGANASNRMANQVQTGYNNLQAGEAKQVTPGFNRPNLSPNLTQSQLAGNITGGGGNLTFGGGQNVTRDYSKTDLGKAGIDPSMVGGYGINLGDQKLSPAEFRNIGAERDSLVNNYGKPAHLSTPVGGPRSIAELENLSQYNRALGLNQTSGMGFGESFRHNLGGLEAQRDFARLGNFGKGIMNLMPGRALMTGLLNKIPGVNLPTELSMSPINYNITDQMMGSDLANILSKEQQEMYSPDLMNRYLFGSQPDAVTQSDLQPLTQSDRQPFLDADALDRAETDRGTNFYREHENYLKRNNLTPEEVGMPDDFLRRNTDFYNRPPVFGETSGDVALMDKQGITSYGTAIGPGDLLFDKMTNQATDLDGDGRISTSELHAAREPESMQYGDMGLFRDRFPDTAEEKAAYAADPNALARKDAWLRKQMGMEAFNPGFKEWTTTIPMDNTRIMPEGHYQPETINKAWYDPLGWFTGNTIVQTGGYNPSTGLSTIMGSNDPADMASTFFHENMHRSLQPLTYWGEGDLTGDETYIREMLGEPSPIGLGYTDSDTNLTNEGRTAFSDLLGWGLPEATPEYTIDPTLNPAMSAIQQIETGGLENPDKYIGDANEWGRFQIKPSTAMAGGYGIESLISNPEDLQNPDIARAQAENIYTNMANAIGADLSTTEGQIAAAVAYNRGVEGYRSNYGKPWQAQGYMNDPYGLKFQKALANETA